MFRSYWLPAIAIGLVLSGTATANPKSGNANHQGNAQERHAQPQATPAPQIPAIVQADIKRMADALEAENTRAESKAGKQYAADYLKAQQDMAKWAAWMLLIAGIEAAVTVIGVVLVGFTLHFTSRAARAAEKTVKVTRNVGRAQARAYIDILSASISFDSSPEGNYDAPSIIIAATNSGDSPAINFAWIPTLQYVCGKVTRERKLARLKPERGIRIPAMDHREDREQIGEMELCKFADSLTPPTMRAVIRLRIEFKFVDVFGVKFEDVAYFDGVANRECRVIFIAGKQLDRWAGYLKPMPVWRNWDAPPTEEED